MKKVLEKIKFIFCEIVIYFLCLILKIGMGIVWLISKKAYKELKEEEEGDYWDGPVGPFE